MRVTRRPPPPPAEPETPELLGFRPYCSINRFRTSSTGVTRKEFMPPALAIHDQTGGRVVGSGDALAGGAEPRVRCQFVGESMQWPARRVSKLIFCLSLSLTCDKTHEH